jgi:hypothetical protein
MNDLSPLTDAQFAALPRYTNDRIKNLPDVFLLLTPEQVERLHEDDWSYYHELEEEIAHELWSLNHH